MLAANDLGDALFGKLLFIHPWMGEHLLAYSVENIICTSAGFATIVFLREPHGRSQHKPDHRTFHLNHVTVCIHINDWPWWHESSSASARPSSWQRCTAAWSMEFERSPPMAWCHSAHRRWRQIRHRFACACYCNSHRDIVYNPWLILPLAMVDGGL